MMMWRKKHDEDEDDDGEGSLGKRNGDDHVGRIESGCENNGRVDWERSFEANKSV